MGMDYGGAQVTDFREGTAPMAQRKTTGKVLGWWFVILIGVAFVVAWYVYWRMPIQASISPDEVASLFEDAGYEIVEVKVPTDYPMLLGPGVGRGKRIIMHYDNREYIIFAIAYPTRRDARNVARHMNAFDRTMSHTHASSFNIDSLFVFLHPSDYELAARVERVLRQAK
jgi:hypothetical protein